MTAYYCKRCHVAVDAAPIATPADRPPLSPAEIDEIYRAILSRTPDDPAKARTGLEAYLAGYNRTMPVRA